MRPRRPGLSRLGLLAVAGVLIAAFALRVWDLPAADLTFDEVATVYVAHRTIPEVIRYVAGAAREHPPAYYLGMSLWMQGAGTSEFAIRYPSALIGLLAAAWSFRVGRRLLGRRGGWWSLLLCSVAPLSVWAGRNGRMYSLVMLLSLAIIDSWLRWRGRPTWRNWLAFTGLSMIGAMTHYYLALLWPAQALLFLLLPRRTRAIRRVWLVTLAATGVAVAAFIAISPGIRAMAINVAQRFPFRGFRGEDLRLLTVSLYLGGFFPELAWTGIVSVGLTVAGWAASWSRDRLAGTLLFAWSLVPLILLQFVPEKLEPRYLMPILPALILSVAALLAAARPWLVQLLGAAGLIWFSVWRLPTYYDNPDTTFSGRMRTLNIAALPNDALVMNGPWPRLLLRYYQPPSDLDIYGVPEAAPPGFSEEVDISRLETIAAKYERLWVSYGAIHWTDPEYSVSRWLAENTYCVFEQDGMTLCLPSPEELIETAQALDLGSRLILVQAGVDRQSAQMGESVRVRLDLEGIDLDRSVSLELGLLDSSGKTWAQRESRLGPVHQPSNSVLPERWSELSGLWLLPGIPPGDYTLALRIYGHGVDMAAAAISNGWIPISPFEVLPGCKDPYLVQMLPGNQELDQGSNAGELSLVGLEPYATDYMQGYPAGFHLWWLVRHAGDADRLQVRLAGPETTDIGSFPLGPESYPAAAWQTGDVIRQSVFFQLSSSLAPGVYQVQAQLWAKDGTPQPVAGADTAENGWLDLFALTVESRAHDYRPPLAIRRRRAGFGGVLQLEGYRLGTSNLHAGDETQLTVYWRALQQPQRIYAVFNHLRAADNATVWQDDSWPKDGIYTTDRWLEGEVVAETYAIKLPATLPPGKYKLYTGVYEPTTGDRLMTTDGEGQRLQNDELVLFELEVKK